MIGAWPPPEAVLLDTCALIWLASGAAMAEAAVAAIVTAGLAGGILVSPVSGWEIGLLSTPRGGRPPKLLLRPDPVAWFDRVIAGPGLRETPLTGRIAAGAAALPGDLHGDPGDRLLVATARALDVPLVTRDGRILAYAATGRVRALRC